MPPNPPYPISGTLQDELATNFSGATVTAFNSTKGTRMKSSGNVTTETNGQFIIDMANLDDYSNNDVIYIAVLDSTYKRSYWRRTTINTVNGSENIGTVYLKNCNAILGDENRVNALTVTNLTGSAVTVNLRDVGDDIIIETIRCPANNTIPIHYSDKGGLQFDGAVAVIRSDEGVTSNRENVKVTVKITEYR